MPKRKRNNDLDYISDQIKKLKKKLKRARKLDDSPSSSGTDSKKSGEDIDLLDLPEALETEDDLLASTEQRQNTELKITSEPLTASTNIDQTSNEVPSTEPEDSLDKDILEILGDDPKNNTQHGPEIHKELASRLQHITANGLTKETKKELQQKYLLPSNATLLGAPSLNPEIKAALPETLVSRDKAIESKQKLLGSAISCLAGATSYLLESKDKNTELLKKLMDAAKILCDIQHSDSTTRRMFSTSVLKKYVKSQIMTAKIDSLLFGESLPETLKSAKAVSKSSAEIKYSTNNKKPQPSTSKASNLNTKTPAASFRKPSVTTQKTRQPAPHQSQPVKQYRPSSQPQKNNNNNNYRRS